MDLKQVEKILEKYWEGNSSMEEERMIRDFFAFGDVPEQLEMYRDLFLTPEHSIRAKLGRDFDEEIIKKISEKPSQNRWNILKIAAVGLVLIIASISVFQMDTTQATIAEDTTETPEEALAETKRAFLMIAEAMTISEKQVMMFSKLDETKEKIKTKDEN